MQFLALLDQTRGEPKWFWSTVPWCLLQYCNDFASVLPSAWVALLNNITFYLSCMYIYDIYIYKII